MIGPDFHQVKSQNKQDIQQDKVARYGDKRDISGVTEGHGVWLCFDEAKVGRIYDLRFTN